MSLPVGGMMRILIVSDDLSTSWGAERRIVETLGRALRELGYLVELAGPGVVAAPGGLARLCDGFLPEAVHIATGGPAARRARDLCVRRAMPYSTSGPGPEGGAIPRLGDSAAVLVSGPEAALRLRLRWGVRTAVWTPGVDLAEFRPTGALAVDTARPVTGWSGSLDEDRAVRRYLEGPLAGTRFVIGEGRLRRALSREFPTARFVGALPPRALAALYSCLDAFVHTDTSREFPVEVLEALACGTPVACLPGRGVAAMTESCPGVALDEDLARGVSLVARTPSEACVRGAARHRASSSARAFADALVPGTWCAPFDGHALSLAA